MIWIGSALLITMLLCSAMVCIQNVQARGDKVNMKVRLQCINSLTGKYQASVKLVSHRVEKDGAVNNTPVKNGEKKLKKLDFYKILAKDDDDSNTYDVNFKFKNVNEGDGFQAESKSLEHKFSFRESNVYFRPGNWDPPTLCYSGSPPSHVN